MRYRFLSLLTLIIFCTASATAADEFARVRIETTAGEIVIELDANRSPLTVANFLQYVKDEFYEGTIFHRVVSGFVVQGGGYTADLSAKETRPQIPNESGNGLSNRRMTIAMARTGEPHSADSQFYFNLADNMALDPKPTRWGYTVFGQVIEGSDIVDAIGYRPTSPQEGFQNLPAAPVIIEKMVLVTAKPD